MEGEPQVGRTDLEERGIEGTEETTETEKIIAERWFLYTAEAGV